MKQKRKASVIISILLILALLVSVSFLTGNKLINNIYTSFTNRIGESSDSLAISHTVYDNQDENNVKVLLKVNSNDGLEYVIRQDGTKINANGKNEINLDYSTPLDTENTFKIKEVGKAEIENKQTITQEYINNQMNADCRLIVNTDVEVIRIDESYKKDTDTLEFKKVNPENSWKTYNNEIRVFGTDEQEEYLDEEGNTTVYIKKEDKAGNIIYTNIKIQIPKIEGAQALEYPILTDTGIYNCIKNGEYYYSSIISVTATDAIGKEVYDRNQETSLKGGYGYIDVAESIKNNRMIYFPFWVTSSAYSWASVSYIDLEGTKKSLTGAIHPGSIDVSWLKVPLDCSKIIFEMQMNVVLGDILIKEIDEN